ncbi:putative deoxynucleoside monophosphate kinase [Cronobacter phage vB_CsaM_GAP32]|uniref:Putative deoxynucleoside monophosphate kinase n=1 Tax=Cronobacter phage vB_CsaM_GAP32 TaxID=1141136 RepID=K4F7E6_9CAUD|nr:putative deoxynucleoside monophosphate kinase [Cronobacter phage vB_CsaM_GAP32]AFC21647.1 putative deoxynucleoside monophosphate kinase [Cronobacter phage vB_CsaM_GAP32]
MERKLVAINGTIGSGKDTFSQVFIDNGFYRVSFAETLKDAVSAIFGWDREMLEGTTDESRKIREQPDEYWSSKLGRDVTPRWVLQNLGTDVLRRRFHDNIWVFAAENKIRNLPCDRVIITDCRFPNELKMIRENNGTVIEVQRVLPDWYWDAYAYNLETERILAGYPLDDELDRMFGITTDVPPSMKNVHSSEYGWVGINRPDYIVENNSTIDALHSQAYSILSNIIK